MVFVRFGPSGAEGSRDVLRDLLALSLSMLGRVFVSVVRWEGTAGPHAKIAHRAGGSHRALAGSGVPYL